MLKTAPNIQSTRQLVNGPPEHSSGRCPQINDANGAVLSPIYRRDSADQPILRRKIVLGDDHQLSNEDVWHAMAPLAPGLESQNVLLGPALLVRVPSYWCRDQWASQ
ncbi:hypothetical protein ACLKA6_014010 [Drosophila palustris]